METRGKRGAFVRMCLALVLLFTVVPPTPSVRAQDKAGDEPHEEADLDLVSPREVFRTFLSAMEAYGEGKSHQLARATKCLNLSELPPIVREARGTELVVQLLNVINRIRFVDFQKLPDQDAQRPYVFYESGEGAIVVKRYGANWQFSTETVRDLPELFRALESKPVVKGVSSEIEDTSLRTRIRSQVPEMLKGRFFLLEHWQWLGVFAILLLTYVVKQIGYWIAKALLERVARRLSGLESASKLTEVAQPLAFFFLAVIGELCINLLDLPLGVYTWLALGLALIRVLALLVVAYRLIDVLSEYLLKISARTATRADDLLVPLFQRIGKVAVVVVGIVLVAGLFDFNVTGLVAGLGLGGLAFALAAKDTVENLFGSITVLLDQPFAVGDYVSVGGMEGTVEHIGLRSTRLRTPLNSVITMPNSTLIAQSVENLGARVYRRVRLTLGLTYDTTPDKLEEFCQAVRGLVDENPHTRKDYYHVEFNEFGDSSLNILLNVYFTVSNYTDELRYRREFLLDIMRAAERIGVEFAFPTRTVHLVSENAA